MIMKKQWTAGTREMRLEDVCERVRNARAMKITEKPHSTTVIIFGHQSCSVMKTFTIIVIKTKDSEVCCDRQSTPMQWDGKSNFKIALYWSLFSIGLH